MKSDFMRSLEQAEKDETNRVLKSLLGDLLSLAVYAVVGVALLIVAIKFFFFI